MNGLSDKICFAGKNENTAFFDILLASDEGFCARNAPCVRGAIFARFLLRSMATGRECMGVAVSMFGRDRGFGRR